jgi:hypothetical protein
MAAGGLKMTATAQLRAMMFVSITFTIAALVMWPLAFYWTFQQTWTDATLSRAGAVVFTASAIMCWLALWLARLEHARHGRERERERLAEDMSVLIRTLAVVVPSRPVAKAVHFPRAL